MPPFVPEDRQYRGFTYQPGEAAFEETVESRSDDAETRISMADVPWEHNFLTHMGKEYSFTGRKKKSVYTGRPVWEMAAKGGSTIWIDENGIVSDGIWNSGTKRSSGSGSYTYKGITFIPTGRKGRSADGKLELVYEYESKAGEVIWVSESGRVFYPNQVAGALKPANWMPSDLSMFPGYKGKRSDSDDDVEERFRKTHGPIDGTAQYDGERYVYTGEAAYNSNGGEAYLMKSRSGKKIWVDKAGDFVKAA